MVAEGGHAGLADRGAPVLDEVDEVVVGERGEGVGIGEVAGPQEKERGAPGAMPVGAVALGAVGEVEALGGRRVPRNRVREEEQRENAADQQDQRRPHDDQQPPQPPD